MDELPLFNVSSVPGALRDARLENWSAYGERAQLIRDMPMDMFDSPAAASIPRSQMMFDVMPASETPIVSARAPLVTDPNTLGRMYARLYRSNEIAAFRASLLTEDDFPMQDPSTPQYQALLALRAAPVSAGVSMDQTQPRRPTLQRLFNEIHPLTRQ